MYLSANTGYSVTASVSEPGLLYICNMPLYLPATFTPTSYTLIVFLSFKSLNNRK